MSINGRDERTRSEARRDRAQYRAQKEGGDWREFLDEDKPRFRIWQDENVLKQAGYRLIKTYDYTTPNGVLLYQVLRWQHEHVPREKAFSMRRPTPNAISDPYFADGGLIKIPYRWPELVAPTRANEFVWVTEGEKDADRLHDLGFLATTVAGQHWSETAAEALVARNVCILEDNDEAGRDNAREFARWLQRHAKSVRIVRLPRLGYGQDVSDWLDAGASPDDLVAVGTAAPLWGLATPLPLTDPAQIPRRDWLYGSYYLRQTLSLTVAPGGAKKSSLLIAEALALASGKPLLDIPVFTPLRVWYWNGEDPFNELQRRFGAAQKHFGVKHADLGNCRLFVNSGHDVPLTIAEERQRGVKVDEAGVETIITNIRRNSLDVVILDPFVSTHRVEENNNSGIDRVAKLLAQIAIAENCSIMIAHHVRKHGAGDATVEDARGASALVNAARFARTLNVMTADEAVAAKIEPTGRWRYSRIEDGKTNYSPPAENAEWITMVSVDLENPGMDADWFKSDNVGVTTPWMYPKTEALEPTPGDVAAVLAAMRDSGSWRYDLRAKEWFGKLVARTLKLDERMNRKAIVKLIDRWIEEGRLTKVARAGRRGKRTEQYDYVEAAGVTGVEQPRNDNPGERPPRPPPGLSLSPP